MELEQLIGADFEYLKSTLGAYGIESNDAELQLEEGFEEEFYVTIEEESLEFILTEQKIIHTIFISPKENGEFCFQDYTTNLGRVEIRKRFGEPDKEGAPLSNPILGDNGGFDRFDKEIAYHFEYANSDQTQLKKITLMALDVAP